MAAESEGVHSSVKAIQDMEAACARFARTLVERLPDVGRELRRVTDALEDRGSHLRGEIANLKDRLTSEDEDEDLSWERNRLEEAEDDLASVQRRIRRLSEVESAYAQQARKVEHLANAHSIQAREFLNGAAEDLKAYLASSNEVPVQSAVGDRGNALRAACFGNADSADYRLTFFTAYPFLKGQVVVHHAVPQQVLKLYPGVVTAFQMHSLENLRGIPKEINNEFHQSLINSEWNAFFRAHPQSATKEQLLDMATKTDEKYGHNFLPPTRDHPI